MTAEKATVAIKNMQQAFCIGNSLDNYGDWIAQWTDGSSEAYRYW